MTEQTYKQPHRYSSASSDKNRRPTSERGSLLLRTQNADDDLLFKDSHITSCDNHSIGGDREMLLKTHSKLSDSYSDELVPSDPDSCVTTLPVHDTSFESVLTKRDTEGAKTNTEVSQKFSNLGREGLSKMATQCVPALQAAQEPVETFHLSANSLLFSDSDSGADDTNDRTVSKNKQRQSQQFYPMTSLTSMTPSVSHNGVLCNGGHNFNDFQPPPPPYGALKTKSSALDKNLNDFVVTH